MAIQTLAILRKFSNLGPQDIPAKAEEVVHEYQRFAESTYVEMTADVDFERVIQDVISQFTGDIAIFSVSSPNKNTKVFVYKH